MEADETDGGTGRVRHQLQPGAVRNRDSEFCVSTAFRDNTDELGHRPSDERLTLVNGFPGTAPGNVTNNFAVDPNYRLGYVQIWNVDVQRQLPHGFLLNVGYNGSKGTRLDVERAITTNGTQPFIYESSAGNSILHSASVRVRKRMSTGIGFSGSYVFSKSIDDASSIGGGGVVVAQDPFDIAADRSLSSFDQRHKFTGSWMYDLPFGENHRLASKGASHTSSMDGNGAAARRLDRDFISRRDCWAEAWISAAA